MDLDQLKDIWKGLDEPVGGSQGKEEIMSMLKKRSQGPIAKMKRNLRLEVIMVFITYSAMIIHYFISFDQEFQSVSWFLLTIALLFLLYCYKKNKLLNEMQQVTGKVKLHLQQQVTTLEKFVRFYRFAATALVPICLAFYGWIIYNQLQDFSSGSLFFPAPGESTGKAIFAWIVLTVSLTLIVYAASVWLLNKMYGNHIRKLKEIVREMSEQ
jgi:hypothetical protein